MPRFLPFSLDTKIRKVAAVGLGIAILTLVLGIWFGYLAGHSAGQKKCYVSVALRDYCSRIPFGIKKTKASNYFWRSLKKYKQNVCLPKTGSCHEDGLPRHYIAYHLGAKTVVIDGRDSDQAWAEVSWSQNFIDMRGEQYPKPRFDTRFKMRWDDTKMYVLIYVQETDLYGTHAVNDSNDKGWTVELALDWAALAKNSSRATPQPSDNEVWFMQFGRSEWKLNVTNNTYVKAETKGRFQAEDWWSWQSCRAINLHLQDRWGLVQFKKNLREKAFLSTQWHMYKALFAVHDALTSYKALNKQYTDSIYDLDVPTSLLTRVCVEIPTVSLYNRNGTQDFNVTVTSRLITNKTGHIRSDRYVWFD